jgi:hypothetical protein
MSDENQNEKRDKQCPWVLSEGVEWVVLCCSWTNAGHAGEGVGKGGEGGVMSVHRGCSDTPGSERLRRLAREGEGVVVACTSFAVRAIGG